MESRRANLAMTSDRMPPLTDEVMTDAQRLCAREIAEGPRGGVYGPFIPLLRSPELAAHAQRMGEYLRYRSAIGARDPRRGARVVATRGVGDPRADRTARWDCRRDDRGDRGKRNAAGIAG